MAWYDNPAFGSYQDEEYSDGQPSKASFGVRLSKQLGDGMWCPHCRKDGVYSWLELIWKEDEIETYSKCKVHKQRYYKSVRS